MFSPGALVDSGSELKCSWIKPFFFFPPVDLVGNSLGLAVGMRVEFNSNVAQL